ncbi:MAG: DUF4178 domain-containing protein [Sphingomonas sp.]|uniref:DUF4178 domain-containing protein n=1 Tax=Sphingomonas sp. TaxID=28214 RepID=UPI001AC94EC1|nr:DUF4178 domain-containing protein [Sphingomonas sp.]MBN8816926.1 DUF4178 domain-containing protein [Sphingomonas sp.]
MLRASCPNCGAPIAFRSADLPVKVCDYCHSSVLRTGGNLEAMGKVADVPDDVSPLRLGVRGRLGARSFELIGRVRWRYADGAWNEWLAYFDDGSTAWLGESMGRHMLLRQVDLSHVVSDVVKLLQSGFSVMPGTRAVIDNVEYWASDVKRVSCVASEGELPFNSLGLTAMSVDLMSADEHCASIQRAGDEEVEVYAGQYVSLADIAATGLREFEGWPMPSYSA